MCKIYVLLPYFAEFLFDYKENAGVFNVTISILKYLVLDVTVLVPLYQTTLNQVTVKIGNQRKLGWCIFG